MRRGLKLNAMNQTLHIALLIITALLVIAPALMAFRRTARATRPHPAPEKRALSAAEATRRLIGDEAYRDMFRRVEILLSRHAAHNSELLSLCSGADTAEGTERLHSLLPGMPLTLKDASHEGVVAVDVYADSVKVGSLLFSEAERALAIMRSRSVKGVYVSEQSAFGDSSSVSLGIVIFHTAPAMGPSTAPVEKEAIARMLGSAYKFIHAGLHPVVVYQN